MMQGDAYNIQFIIIRDDNTIVTPSMISEVEIVIGTLRKTYSSGIITYSEYDQNWLFPISQSESLALSASNQPVQARIKFTENDEVIGENLGVIPLEQSRSKVVL